MTGPRKPTGRTGGKQAAGAKSGSGSGPGGGQRSLHVRVKSITKASSRAWLERQLNDPYVAAAKRDGMRSRAAYKLAEIDEKYRILKPGMRVIDLGAAPGGWSQIAAERVKSDPALVPPQGEHDHRGHGHRGHVLAIDYLAVDPLPGVTLLMLDFTAPGTEATLKGLLRGGRADVVLSDMAAPTVGHTRTDHLRIMGLAEQAAAFACDVLEPGGTFLCKVFQGGTATDLLAILKRGFATVRHVKPKASRADSAELYVLATGFRGAATGP